MILKLYNGSMKKRRTFTPRGKANIVLEVLAGNRTLREIATEHKVHENQILRWKKQFFENAGAAFEKDSTKKAGEVKQLEEEKEELFKKVGQLTIEVDWLKKKSGFKK